MRIGIGITLGIATGLAACASPPVEVTGQRLYLEHCAACHGADGRGNGPISAEFDREVPDLTRIAHRNGGRFPMARVMSVVDGYTRVQHGGTIMPEFGQALADGPTVLVDTGDGVATPTPVALVAIAEYLRTIQR